jgi:threonine aldolase
MPGPKNLYKGLKRVSGLKLDASPSSNMVYFDLAEHVTLTENQIIEEMKKFDVLVDWAGPRRFRLVTHYWVDDAGVEKAVKGFREVLK